jgi:predicted dienelactone hydrolase
MAMWKCGMLASMTVVHAEVTSIFKEDYPVEGFCGEEIGIEKSWKNPHWLFPMTFGGFTEGKCADIGYSKFKEEQVVAMHPVPWVHHNLTFNIYEQTHVPIIDLELKDPDRPDRTVRAKFCMPSSNESFPLYIFGHGAGCVAEDYEYFCETTATAMVYQRSPAGQIFPVDFDTANAAIDMKFLSTQLIELSQTDSSSPLFGRLDGRVLIGGHSMGGGATVLATGKEGASPDALALFAPGLYTKPDGTEFLPNIQAPTLIVSGSMDCGSNALDKQAQPAFDGLSSESKVLVVLKGANHCQWTSPEEKLIGVCKTFEKNECHAIDMREQQRLGNQLLASFAHGLKDWNSFEADLAIGESAGIWTYFSSKTSAPDKMLHNDCPCGETSLV